MSKLIKLIDTEDRPTYLNPDHIEYARAERGSKDIILKMAGKYILTITFKEWLRIKPLVAARELES